MGQEIYPRGQIAMDNGDLMDVTDFKITYTDGSKQVHTLRRQGAGVTQGNEECTCTFNAVIGENGEEADWIALVRNFTIKQLRFKFPGRTITVNGKYSGIDYEQPADGATTVALTFIGKLQK